jgi:hypothetical protein
MGRRGLRDICTGGEVPHGKPVSTGSIREHLPEALKQIVGSGQSSQ